MACSQEERLCMRGTLCRSRLHRVPHRRLYFRGGVRCLEGLLTLVCVVTHACGAHYTLTRLMNATSQHTASALHGESSKCLAPPTQTTVIRHNSQTKHQALSKGQPRSQHAEHESPQQPCTPPAQHQPAIITHTQQVHHHILSANAARCEAREVSVVQHDMRLLGCNAVSKLPTAEP